MAIYVVALIVFAKVEKGNGVFGYYKTGHDKENCFTGDPVRGHWKRMDTLILDNYAWLHSYDTQHMYYGSDKGRRNIENCGDQLVSEGIDMIHRISIKTGDWMLPFNFSNHITY